MRRLFILVALVAMVSTASFAQVQFGAKAGLNIANGTGDDFEDSDARIAPVFGGFARISLSDNFDFQPELLYSMQGAKGSAIEEGEEADLTMKFDYLNLPLMLKYKVGNGFNIQAGPQVGFLLSAKQKVEFMGESLDVDIKDEVKGLDFGLNFGFGYDLESGLGFDLRYNMGLTPVPDYDEADGKNSVIQFTVGYAF